MLSWRWVEHCSIMLLFCSEPLWDKLNVEVFQVVRREYESGRYVAFNFDP